MREPDSADIWVIAADGERYWGRFGAAGLLIRDPEGRLLLQHRAEWSHHGGTWGVLGGAIREGESALDAAFREAGEEAEIPFDLLTPRYFHVLDRGGWSYTTVLAESSESFQTSVRDHESIAVEWIDGQQLQNLPLHPGLAKHVQDFHELFDGKREVTRFRTATSESGFFVIPQEGERGQRQEENELGEYKDHEDEMIASKTDPDQSIQEAAQLFKLLGSSSRLWLLTLLQENPKNVSELVAATSFSQPLVSRHLQTLRQNALVRAERVGREMIYHVVDEHVTHIVQDALIHVQEERDEEEEID